MARIGTFPCEIDPIVATTGCVETGGLTGTFTHVSPGRLGLGQCLRGDTGAGNAQFAYALIRQDGTTQSNAFATASRTYFMRTWVRFNQPYTSSVTFFRHNCGSIRLGARMNTDGTISHWEEVGPTVYFTTPWSVVLGQWYMVELKTVIDATPNVTTTEMRINGVVLSTVTGLAAAATVGTIQLGGNAAAGANVTVDFDDVAVNDDTAGSGQTGYPGDGKIAVLLPLSDNAVGTGWVGGAGGGSPLFGAVDNEPPVGLAIASATNASQIKNITSTTTGNYDVNMQTYASQGITSRDQIKVVQPIWVFGPNGTAISTACLLVSNPQANSGTESTLSLTTAVAAYPSANWRGFNGSKAQIVYNPAITLANLSVSPVMRIGKRTANVAATTSCFMGILVDYIPAPPIPELGMNGLGLTAQQGVKRSAVFCLGEKWARKGRLWVPSPQRPLVLA